MLRFVSTILTMQAHLCVCKCDWLACERVLGGRLVQQLARFLRVVCVPCCVWRFQEEHQDEDAGVRHGQSSRRAYFRELKKVRMYDNFRHPRSLLFPESYSVDDSARPVVAPVETGCRPI